MKKAIKNENINTNEVKITTDKLYGYLITSGYLNPIYMNIFIKLEGMEILSKFQEKCISNKNEFLQTDFDEIRYLLGLIIMNLYKFFKLNDEIEVNNNPFVYFSEDKIVR